MKSTREKIMRTLLAFPRSTINGLAEAVGINGISIRHHLTAMEADDLVTSAEERHGVGRPRLVYSLTDKGVEKFPTSYLRLTQRIIGSLKERFSSEELTGIFEDIGAEIAQAYEPETNGQPLEKKIDLLMNILSEEGFVVELEQDQDAYTLKSLSCPYFRVGKDHPEICALDVNLIASFLSTPVNIESCIFNDANCCTYKIPLQRESHV